MGSSAGLDYCGAVMREHSTQIGPQRPKVRVLVVIGVLLNVVEAKRRRWDDVYRSGSLKGCPLLADIAGAVHSC